MKTFVGLVAISILTATVGTHAQEKKEEPRTDGLKCVVEQLDKAYGIKMKSVATKDFAPQGFDTEIKITFEFTKDVADMKALKETFVANDNPPAKLDTYPLVFHLFDEDNVSLKKLVVRQIQGDLTGVKGDAFRIILQCDTATFKKTKKIEARLLNPPKPEKGKE
jgi:hypothetical protein